MSHVDEGASAVEADGLPQSSDAAGRGEEDESRGASKEATPRDQSTGSSHDAGGAPQRSNNGEHTSISTTEDVDRPDSVVRPEGPRRRCDSGARRNGLAHTMHCSQPEGVDQRIGHMDIAQFPTDKLLEMLTGLLYKIIKSNDRLKPFDQEKHDINNKYVAHVLSFRGKHIPTITLGDYFARIQKYCPITNDVFLSLLVYFDRIAKRCNALDPQLFVMDSYNIHRLIIAAVTVSTKFFSDFFYSNSRYARVGGISLEELNRLELQFSILCDFELIVSIQELQRYADLLYKFWHREHLAKASTNAAVPH